MFTAAVRRQILDDFLGIIADISDKEYQRRVWIRAEGPEVDWGVGGLFLWPLFIPAVYDGICSSEANDELDRDYKSKALTEHTIRPHTTFSRLFFLTPEETEQRIETFLLNEKTNEKVPFFMQQGTHA